MKEKPLGCLIAFLIVALAILAKNTLYTVNETEQVIITKFGKPIGDPITEAGLRWKIPLIHEVNRFEKRILEWDGLANEMPTKDKTYIIVDTYARWRIADSRLFLEKLRDERSAQSRLSDILGSETRNTIAKNELIEVIRTTKDRQVTVVEELIEADKTGSVGKLVPIRSGRGVLEGEILAKSRKKLAEFGIELLDIRFKRINYNSLVSRDIYARMISERQQIAERFRSEGAGEAAKILGSMERDLLEIRSKAYKEVEIIKGGADAQATEIYAEAYNQSPESVAFYEFVKTMEIYPEILDEDSTVILSTDSDLFQFLRKAAPSIPQE
jgi:membrane protease subunit HflC